ncbi:hypothetical protein V8G54_028104 [Vigna mungo]|uniref:Uncharacterized protein n=1 Tax=Vigna mungo TaxID=3915 RepID=A0AAQ3RKK8_VIGMU
MEKKKKKKNGGKGINARRTLDHQREKSFTAAEKVAPGKKHCKEGCAKKMQECEEEEHECKIFNHGKKRYCLSSIITLGSRLLYASVNKTTDAYMPKKKEMHIRLGSSRTRGKKAFSHQF